MGFDDTRGAHPGGEPGREAGAVAGAATTAGEVSSSDRAARLKKAGGLSARHDRDLGDVWDVLLSIRDTVENDHAHRLRRIETDLRWVIALLAGLVIALVGAALSGVFGG